MPDSTNSTDSIIKNACGIYIKNEVFDSNNIFTFFENNNQHSCLIYGENGSGKTILSEAFNQLKKQLGNSKKDAKGENVKSKVYLTDEKEKDVNPKNLDLSNNIFVFNEKFTHENLGIKKDLDALSSIILLGDDVKLDKEISEKNEELEKLNKEQKDLKNSHTDNSYNFIPIMQKAFSQYSRWGENLSKIYGMFYHVDHPHSADDKMKIIEKFKDEVSKDTFNIEQLENDFTTKFTELHSKEALIYIQEKSTFAQYQQKINDEDLQKINELLAEEIKTDALSPREEKIKLILKGKYQELIISADEYFKNNVTDYCPFCLQNVDEVYKAKLLEEIEKVFYTVEIETLKAKLNTYKEKLENICDKNSLNKQIETYKDDLKNTLSRLIPPEPLKNIIENYKKNFDVDENKFLNEIENSTLPINEFYTDLLAKIEHKIKNPYEIFKIENNLANLINKANGKIEEFNSAISTFNEEIEKQKIKTGEKQKELKELNNKWLYFTIKDDYDAFLKERKKNEDSQSKTSKKEKEITSINEEISKLEAKRFNTGLAAEKINEDFKLIFLAKRRLSLKLNENSNQYEIFSNNKAIKPLQLSTGERNAISLCYFFYKNSSTSNENKIHKNNSIFIIDDPITSFDINNQLGLYSFLRNKFRQIKKTNPNNKIIMLTHNGFAMYQLQKILHFVFGRKKYSTFHLKNKALETIDNNFNTYGKLLKDVYRYATREEDELKNDIYNRTIGNIIRRVLESFSALIYNAKFKTILNDPNLFSEKEKEEIERIIPDYFLALLVNEESHLENRSNAATDTNMVDNFITKEKQMAAKITIILLYKINKIHVENFLISEDNNADYKAKNKVFKNIINKCKKDNSLELTKEALEEIVKEWEKNSLLPLNIEDLKENIITWENNNHLPLNIEALKDIIKTWENEALENAINNWKKEIDY